MGRDGHLRGMLAHLRAPGYGQTAQSRGDGAVHGAVRPHPRGWRHIPARGSVSSTGGRRDAHTLRQTPSGKEAAASLGAAPGCLCLGDGRWHGQGGTLRPPFPAWEGDAVATLRGKQGTHRRLLGCLRGRARARRSPAAAAHSSSHSWGLPRGQNGRDPRSGMQSSFGRHPAARAVSAADGAAPRTVMLGQGRRGCGVTPETP